MSALVSARRTCNGPALISTMRLGGNNGAAGSRGTSLRSAAVPAITRPSLGDRQDQPMALSSFIASFAYRLALAAPRDGLKFKPVADPIASALVRNEMLQFFYFILSQLH